MPAGTSCTYGRQETLHFTPTDAGTYTITASGGDGTGGSFAIDLFTGPIAAQLLALAVPIGLAVCICLADRLAVAVDVAVGLHVPVRLDLAVGLHVAIAVVVDVTVGLTVPDDPPSSSSSPPPAPTVHVGDLDDQSVTLEPVEGEGPDRGAPRGSRGAGGGGEGQVAERDDRHLHHERERALHR